MPKARRKGVAAAGDRCDAEILADAVAELERLDAAVTASTMASPGRWCRSALDLGRPLTLRMLAYKLQAQRLGDLDKASLRELVEPR